MRGNVIMNVLSGLLAQKTWIKPLDLFTCPGTWCKVNDLFLCLVLRLQSKPCLGELLWGLNVAKCMKTRADCRCLLNKSHYHYKIQYIYKTCNVVSTVCLAFVPSHFSHVWLPWDPMDCSPPGSSVHGILQTRILDWVAMPFSWVLCALRYA